MDFEKLKKNALEIHKKDLKALTSNKIVVITILAIIIVPSLYSLLNIAAWDVYNQTDQIPIAIVNEDEGGVYNGKNINFGNELVKGLKNNTKFD